MKTVNATFATEAELQEALRLLHQFHFDQAKHPGTTIEHQTQPYTVTRVSAPTRGRWWSAAVAAWTSAGTLLGAVGGFVIGDNVFAYLTDGTVATMLAATLVGLSIGLLLGFSLGTLVLFFAPNFEDQYLITTRTDMGQAPLIAVQVPNQRRGLEAVTLLRQAHGQHIALREGDLPRVIQDIPSDVNHVDPY